MKDFCNKVDIEHLYSMIIDLQEAYVRAISDLEAERVASITKDDEKEVEKATKSIVAGSVASIDVNRNGTFLMVPQWSDNKEVSMFEAAAAAYEVIKPGSALRAEFSWTPEGHFEAEVNDKYFIRLVNLSEYSGYLDFAPKDDKDKNINVSNRDAYVLFKRDANGAVTPVMSLGFARSKVVPKDKNSKLVLNFKTTKSLYAGSNRLYYLPDSNSRVSFKFGDLVRSAEQNNFAVSDVMIFYGDKKFGNNSLINRVYPFLKPGMPFVIMARGSDKMDANQILSIAQELLRKPYWTSSEIKSFNSIVDYITIRLVTTEIDLHELPDFVAKNISANSETSLEKVAPERVSKVISYNRIFNAKKLEDTVIYKIYQLVEALSKDKRVIEQLKASQKTKSVADLIVSKEANRVLSDVKMRLEIAKSVGKARIDFDTGPLLHLFKVLREGILESWKGNSGKNVALEVYETVFNQVGLNEKVRLNVAPNVFGVDGGRLSLSGIAALSLSFLRDVAILRETSFGLPAVSIELADDANKPAQEEKSVEKETKEESSSKPAGVSRRRARTNLGFDEGNSETEELRSISGGEVEFNDSVSRVHHLVNKAFGGNLNVAFEGDLIEVNVKGEARLAYGVAKPLMVRLATKDGQASVRVAAHEMVHELKYFLPVQEYIDFIDKARRDLIKSGRIDSSLPQEEIEEQLALWVEEYVDRFENDILFGRYYQIRDSLPSVLRPIFDVMVAGYYYFLRLFNLIDRNVAVDTLYNLYTGEYSNLSPSYDEGGVAQEENYRLADKTIYSKLGKLHEVMLSSAKSLSLPNGIKSVDGNTWRLFKSYLNYIFRPGNKNLLSSYLMSKQAGYKGDKALEKAWESIMSFYSSGNLEALDNARKNIANAKPSYLPNILYLTSFEGDDIYKAYGVKGGSVVDLAEKFRQLGENLHFVSYLIASDLFGPNAYYYDSVSGRSYNVFVTGMFLNSLALSNEGYFRELLKMPGMLQTYRLFLMNANNVLSNEESGLYKKVEETDKEGNKIVKLVLNADDSVAFSNDEVDDILNSINTLLDELEDEDVTSWRDIDEKKTFSLSEALKMALEGLVKPDLKPGDIDDFYNTYNTYNPNFNESKYEGYENKFVRGETLIKAIQAKLQEVGNSSEQIEQVLKYVDDVLSNAKNRVNYTKGKNTNYSLAGLLSLEYVGNPYVDFSRKSNAFISKVGKTQNNEMHYSGDNIDFYARALQSVINYAHDYIEMSRAAGREITPEIYDKAFQYGALIVGSSRPDVYALVYSFYNQYILPSYQDTPFFAAFNSDPFEKAVSLAISRIYDNIEFDKEENVIDDVEYEKIKDSLIGIEKELEEYKKRTKDEFNKRVFITQKILTTLFNYIKYDNVSVSLKESRRSGSSIGKISGNGNTLKVVHRSLEDEVLLGIMDNFFVKKKDFHGYLSNLQQIEDLNEVYSVNPEVLHLISPYENDKFYLLSVKAGEVKSVDEDGNEILMPEYNFNYGKSKNSPFFYDFKTAIELLLDSESNISLEEFKNLKEIKDIDKKYHFWGGNYFKNNNFVDKIIGSHLFHVRNSAYDSKNKQFKDGIIGTFFTFKEVYSVFKHGDNFYFLPINRGNGNITSYKALDGLPSNSFSRESLLSDIKAAYDSAIIDIYNNTPGFLSFSGYPEIDVLNAVNAALTVASYTASPLRVFFNREPYSINDLRDYVLSIMPESAISLTGRSIALTHFIQKISERGAKDKRKQLYSMFSVAHNVARMYAYGIAPKFFKYTNDLKGITRKAIYDRGLHPVVDSNLFRGDAAIITSVKSIVDGREHDVTELYPADYALMFYIGALTFPAVGRNTYLYLNATTGYDAQENYKLRAGYFKALVHEIFNMLWNDGSSELKEKMSKANPSFNLNSLANSTYDEDVLAKIQVINNLFSSLDSKDGVALLRKAGLVEKLSYEVKNGKIVLPQRLVEEATKTDVDITLSLLRSAIKDLDMFRTMMRSEPPSGTGVVSDIYARRGVNMAGGTYYQVMTVEADIYAAMIDYIEKGDTSRLGQYFPIVKDIPASTATERASVIRRLVGISKEALVVDNKTLLKEGEMPIMNTPTLPLRFLNLRDFRGLSRFMFDGQLPGADNTSIAISILEQVLTLAGIDTTDFYQSLTQENIDVNNLNPAERLNLIVNSGRYGELAAILSNAAILEAAKKQWSKSEDVLYRVDFVRGVIKGLKGIAINEDISDAITNIIDSSFGRLSRDQFLEKKVNIANLRKRYDAKLNEYLKIYRRDLFEGQKVLDGTGYLPYDEVINLFEQYAQNSDYPFKERVNDLLRKLIPQKSVVDEIAKMIREGASEEAIRKVYLQKVGISFSDEVKKDFPLSKLVNSQGELNVDMLNKMYNLLLTVSDEDTSKLIPLKFTPAFYRRFPNLETRFFAQFLLSNRRKDLYYGFGKVKVKGAPYSVVGEEETTIFGNTGLYPFQSGYASSLDLGNLQALHNELNFFHTAVAFMGNPLAYKDVATLVKRYIAVQTGHSLPVINKYYNLPSKFKFIVTKDKSIGDFSKGKEALAEDYDYMNSYANGYNQFLHISELGFVGDPNKTPVDDGGGFMLPYIGSPMLGYDRYKPGPYKDAFAKIRQEIGGVETFIKHAHFPLPPSFAYNASERLHYVLDRLLETESGALKRKISDLMKSFYDEGMRMYKDESKAVAYMIKQLRSDKVQDRLAEIVREHMHELKYLGVVPESALKNAKDYVAVDINELDKDKDVESKAVPADITGYGLVTYLFQSLGIVNVKSPAQHKNVFQGSGINAKLFDRLSDVFSMIIENNLASVSNVLADEINRKLSLLEDGKNVPSKLLEVRDKLLKDNKEGGGGNEVQNQTTLLLEALGDLYNQMLFGKGKKVDIKGGSVYLDAFIQDIIISTIRHAVMGLDGSATMIEMLKKPNNISFPTLVEKLHEGLSRLFASKSRSVRGNRLIIQGASHIAEIVEVEISKNTENGVRYEYHVMSKEEALKEGYLSAEVTFGDGLPKVKYKTNTLPDVRVVMRPIRPHVMVKEDPKTGKRTFLSEQEISKIYELYNKHYRAGRYNDTSKYLTELNNIFKEQNIKVLHGEIIVGNIFMDDFALRPGMSIGDYDSNYVRAIHVLEEAGLLSQYNMMKNMSLEEFINLPDVANTILPNVYKGDTNVTVKDLFVKDDKGQLTTQLIDLSKSDISVHLKKAEKISDNENKVIEARNTSAGEKAVSARLLLKTDEDINEEELLKYAKDNKNTRLEGDKLQRLKDIPPTMNAETYFNLVSAASRYSFELAISNLVATRIPVSNINAIRGLRVVAFEEIGNVAFVPSEYLFIAGEDSDGDAYTTEIFEPKRLIIDPSYLPNKKLLEMTDTLYSPINIFSTYKELSIDKTLDLFSDVYDKAYGVEEVAKDVSGLLSLAGTSSRATTAVTSQKLIGLTVKGVEGVNLLKASILKLKREGLIPDNDFDDFVNALMGPSHRYNSTFANGFGFVYYNKNNNGNIVSKNSFVKAFNKKFVNLYKESASYVLYRTGEEPVVQGGDTINEAIEVFLNIALDANKYDLSKLNLSVFNGQYINTLLMMGVPVDDVVRFNLHPMMMVLRQVLEASGSPNIENEILDVSSQEKENTFKDLQRAAASMLVSSNHPLMKQIREKISSDNKQGLLALPVAKAGEEETVVSATTDKSIPELLADYIIDFYNTFGDIVGAEPDGKYQLNNINRIELAKKITEQIGRLKKENNGQLSLSVVEQVLAEQLEQNFRNVFDFWGLVVEMKQKVSGVMAVLEVFKEKSSNYYKYLMQAAKIYNNIFRQNEDRRFLLNALNELVSGGKKLENVDDSSLAMVMALANDHIRSEIRSMLMGNYITSMISPAMDSDLTFMLMRTFGIYGLKNFRKTKNLSIAINNLMKYEYTIKVYGNDTYRSDIIKYLEENNKELDIQEKNALDLIIQSLRAIDSDIKEKRNKNSNPEPEILAFALTLARYFAPMLSRIAGDRIGSWGLEIDNRAEIPVLLIKDISASVDSSEAMSRSKQIAQIILNNPVLHLMAHAHAAVLDDSISRRSIISFIPQVLSVMPRGLEALSFGKMLPKLDSYRHLKEISLMPSDMAIYQKLDGSIGYFQRLNSAHDVLNVLNMLAMDITQNADKRYTADGLVPGVVIRPYLSDDTIKIGYDSTVTRDMFDKSMVSKTILVEGKSHSIEGYASKWYGTMTFVVMSQLGIPQFESNKDAFDFNTPIRKVGPVFHREAATSMLVMVLRPTSVLNRAFYMTVEGPQISPDEEFKEKGAKIPIMNLYDEIMKYVYGEDYKEGEKISLDNKSYSEFIREKVRAIAKVKHLKDDPLIVALGIYDNLSDFAVAANKVIDKDNKSTLRYIPTNQDDFIRLLRKGGFGKIREIVNRIDANKVQNEYIKEYEERKAKLLDSLDAVTGEKGKDIIKALNESNEYVLPDTETFDDIQELFDKVNGLSNNTQSLLDIIKDRPKLLVAPEVTSSQDSTERISIKVKLASRDTSNNVLLRDLNTPLSILSVVGGSAAEYERADGTTGITSYGVPKVYPKVLSALDRINSGVDTSQTREKRVDVAVLEAADVNNKLVTKVIEYISKKLGIPIEFINDPDSDFIGRVGDRGVIVLNMAYITSDTPLHEVAHLFYAVLKKNNPEMLLRIEKAIANDEIPNEVYEFMGYKSRNDMIRSLRNAGYSNDAMNEEITVSVLGALATMRFARHSETMLGSLYRFIDRAIAYFYRVLQRLGIGLNAKQLTFLTVNDMLYNTNYRELEVAIGFKYKKVGQSAPMHSIAELLRVVRNREGYEEPISPTIEEVITQAMNNKGQQTIRFGNRNLTLTGDKALNIKLYKDNVESFIKSLGEGVEAVSDVLGIKKLDSKIVFDEFALMLSNDGQVYVREVNADMLQQVFGLDRELAEEIMSMYDRNRLLLIARPDGERLVYTLLEIVEGEEYKQDAHILNALYSDERDKDAAIGNAASINLRADERDLSMLRNITLLKAIQNRKVEIDGKVYNTTYPSDVRRYSLLHNRIERVHPTIYYRSLKNMMKLKKVRELFPNKLADFISSWNEADVSAFERNVIEEAKMNIDLIFGPFMKKKSNISYYEEKKDEMYEAFSDYLDMPNPMDNPTLVSKVRSIIISMMREYEKLYSKEDGTVDLEKLSKQTGYNILAEALQSIDMNGSKINYYNIEKDVSALDREISPMLQSRSGIIAWFNKIHGKVMNERIKYFTKRLEEINRYISKYKEHASDRLSIFGGKSDNLYAHLFYIDENTGINTFRLLRKGDKGWDSLSNEDKAFIQKVNETIRQLLYDALFERALASGLSVKEAEGEAKKKLDEIYVEGMLPVFPPSLMQKMMNAFSYETLRLDDVYKGLFHDQVEYAKSEGRFIKNLLLVQFNGTELGSSYRQRLLGIYGNKVDVNQNKKLTQDIGKILTVSAFLNSKYVRYMELELVYRAARSMAIFSQRRSGVAMTNIIEQLDKIAEAVIYGNRLSDGGSAFEKAVGRMIYILNQIITVSVLGLSLKTATSNFISNTMAIFRDALVRGSRSKDRFTLDDVAFALNELTTNTSKVMAVLKASRVFQSDEIDILTKRFWGNKPKLTDPSNAFIFDEFGDKIARAITVVAQMKRDGIYDALEYDENTGELTVAENKLFMNKSDGDRPLLVKYLKDRAATEGLVENGRLKSVFYSDYIVRLQAIVNETLGSFSDLDKAAISTSAVMGAITKFRTYMNSLYVRAFGGEKYNPNIRHLRVIDGKVEEIPEFEVGIIRSIVKSVLYLHRYNEFSESPLTEADKDNLIMAMYILSVFMLMYIAGYAMDDDDEDKRTKSFLQRVYSSAVDDLLGILMFGNIKSILSNPFTTYTISVRLWKAFVNLVTLDWEKTAKYGLKTVGVFNTLDIIASDYFDFSKELGKASDAIRSGLGMKTIEEISKEKRSKQGRLAALRRKYKKLIERGYAPDDAYEIVSEEAERKGVDFRVPFYER